MSSIKYAARYLKVHPKKLRRWDKVGFLIPNRTAGGHRRYSQNQLDEFLGIASDNFSQHDCVNDILRVPFGYARVSTFRQKKEGNLTRQADRLEYQIKQDFPKIKEYTIIKDYGSGLNPMRKGIQRLIIAVMENKVLVVYVEFADRLTRFGFPFIETLFKIYNVPIIQTETPPNRTINEQLVDDMISLLSSFSGKLYKNRSLQLSRPNLNEEKIDAALKNFLEKEDNRLVRSLIRDAIGIGKNKV